MSIVDIDPKLRRIIEKSEKIEGPLGGVTCSLITRTRLYNGLKVDGNLTAENEFLSTVTGELSVIAQATVHEEFGRLDWCNVCADTVIRGLDEITCMYNDKKIGLMSAIRIRMLNEYGVPANSVGITLRNVLRDGIVICEADYRRTKQLKLEAEINPIQVNIASTAQVTSFRATPKRIPKDHQ